MGGAEAAQGHLGEEKRTFREAQEVEDGGDGALGRVKSRGALRTWTEAWVLPSRALL